MLADMKFDLCFIFNQQTEGLGVRQISRDFGISLAVVSRIKNYKVDELTVEKLLCSVSNFGSITLKVKRVR